MYNTLGRPPTGGSRSASRGGAGKGPHPATGGERGMTRCAVEQCVIPALRQPGVCQPEGWTASGVPPVSNPHVGNARSPVDACEVAAVAGGDSNDAGRQSGVAGPCIAGRPTPLSPEESPGVAAGAFPLLRWSIGLRGETSSRQFLRGGVDDASPTDLRSFASSGRNAEACPHPPSARARAAARTKRALKRKRGPSRRISDSGDCPAVA